MLTSLAAGKKSKFYKFSPISFKKSKMTKIMKLYQKLDVPKLKTRQTSPEEQEQEQDRTVHVDQPCGW